jgi:hypothetical protein
MESRVVFFFFFWFFLGEFSGLGKKKKSSANHTTHFCEKSVPKLPDFERLFSGLAIYFLNCLNMVISVYIMK